MHVGAGGIVGRMGGCGVGITPRGARGMLYMSWACNR